MSLYDTPGLNYYDLEAVSTIASGGQRWNTYANLVANMSAAVRSQRNEESVLQAGVYHHEKDPEANKQDAMAVIQNGRVLDLDTQVNFLINNPSPASLALEGYTDAKASIIDVTSDPNNFAAVAADESASGNLDEDIVAAIRSQDRAALYASKQLSDISGVDMGVNILEAFIPFMGSPAVDAVDVMKEAGLKQYGYFASEEGMRQIRSNFIRLPQQEQEAAMQFWYDVFLRAADNNELVAGQFTQFLLQPENESNFLIDKIIDTVDATTLGLSMATAITKVVKGSNAIARLTNLGRKEDAALTTKAALDDATGTIAQRLGLNQAEVAAVSQPIDLKDLMGPEIPNSVAIELQRMEESIAFANAQRGNAQMLLDEAAIADRLEAIRRSPKVESVEFIPGDEASKPLVLVTERGGKDEAAITHTFELEETGVFGELRTTKLGAARAAITSPATKFVEDVDTLVSTPTFAQQQVARIKEAYTSLVKDYKKSFRKLKAPERDKVNRILREGDSVGKEYTYSQLRHDFDLSDEAATVYFKHRQLSRNAWNLKSRDMLEAHRRDGFVTQAAGNPVRVIDPGEELKGWSASLQGVKYVWDDTNGKRISVGELATKFAEGAQLVRFRGPKVMAKDGRGTRAFTHAIVSPDSVRELKNTDVLAYRPGYVPKMHENAKYFVTRELTGSVDGIAGRTLGHHVDRAFSDKKGAQAYLDSLSEQERATRQIRYDREYDNLLREEEFRDFSGPFTGARKSEPLLIDGVPDSDLVDITTATAEYYNHLASRGVLDGMRTELQQRWLNTYKNNIRGGFTTFKDAIDNLVGLSAKEEKAAKATHEHISMVLGIKSEAETARQRYVRELMEINPWLNQKFVRKGVLGDILRDPTGMARALTFQLQLGLLNIAQLPVQASGMLVSFGAHPVAFTKMLPQMHLSMLADAMPIKTKNVLGLDKNVYSLWRQSGFAQTVDMNADLADALGTYQPSKLLNIFFRQGELLNRRGAFYTAYDVVRSQKGVDKLDQNSLVEVSNLANKLMLNFSTVNKANWQDGLSGVVFQFGQVMEKSFNQIYNPLMKSPLTTKERWGAGASQLIMFGTMGIPLGTYMWSHVDKLLADQGATPEEAEVIKRGLAGQLTGQIDVGSRIAIGQTMATYWMKWMTGDLTLQGTGVTENLRKGALGPAGVNMARAIEVVDTMNAFKDTNPDIWMTKTARAIATMPASSRNALMLVHYQNTGELISGRGRLLSTSTFLNSWEQAMLGLGFPLKEVEEMFSAADMIREAERAADATADRIVEMADMLMVTDPRQWVDEDSEIFGLISMFDPSQQVIIREKVMRKLLGKPYMEKVGNDALNRSGALDNTTNPFIEGAINGEIQ